MKLVYFLIVIIAVFSDFLLKRFLASDLALAVQYGSALAVLVWMVVVNKKKKHLKTTAKEALIVNFFISYIIVMYCIEAVVSYLVSANIPLLYPINHVLYIYIPLLYITIMLRHCAEFDLVKLSNIFLLSMIPVNLVGLVQYAFDPTFLISTVYSETGGIVLRGYYEGFFERYPSIFASADRYSAIGLMQFYYAFVLLSVSTKKTIKGLLWVNFNLISGIVAMLIAGARSRIIIVLVLIVLMVLSLFFYKKSRSLSRKSFNNLMIAMLIVSFAGIFIFACKPSYVSKIVEAPIVEFLKTSIEDRSVEYRVSRYASRSLLSDDVSFFGEGLGSLGIKGKPAELGIASIWIECGVIGGSLILIGFSGITIILSLLSFRALIGGQPLNVCIFSLPVLALLMGLLAGMTAVFELSSGILLMSAIGGVLRNSDRFSHQKVSVTPDLVIPRK